MAIHIDQPVSEMAELSNKEMETITGGASNQGYGHWEVNLAVVLDSGAESVPQRHSVT